MLSIQALCRPHKALVTARDNRRGYREFEDKRKEILNLSLSCGHEPWLCPSACFKRNTPGINADEAEQNKPEDMREASSGRLSSLKERNQRAR